MKQASVRGVTICKDCKFAERIDIDIQKPTGYCLSTDAPISDYVDGFKYCGDINKKGDCEFFQIYTGAT